MRWLAVLLLLVNLAFWGRQLMIPVTPSTPIDLSHTTAEGRLVLVNELPPGQPLAVREALVPGELPAGVAVHEPEPELTEMEAGQPPPVVSARSCFRVGSFSNEKSAARVKAELEKMGAETMPLVVPRTERTRYWVLLPRAATRAQAMAVVERLKRAGVRDYYLIPNGQNRNALSLGVFSSQEAARRRMAEVAGLRLKVRVEEVNYPVQRFAIDLKWPNTVPPAWSKLLPPDAEANVRECAVAP